MSEIPPPPEDPMDDFPNDDFPKPPRRNPPENYEYTDTSEAVRKLNAPAIALMVVALISALWCIYSIFSAFLTPIEDQIAAMESLGLPFDESMYSQMGGMSQFIGAFFWAFFMLVDFFIFFAAIQMRAAKNYGMCMTAAIISIIPCCWSMCIFLNVPFGIWALVVLQNSDVKRAFGR